MNKHHNRRKDKRNDHLLPYKTIRAATKGDPDAVTAVLRHYSRYITCMATRRLYDEHGNVYLCVDETMSAPVIKCKKTPKKKCRFMAKERKKR